MIIIWPGFFFFIHIYGGVHYFPTTSSRCGVAVPASKSAAEQTGEDVTGPGNKALLITISAKKPANSSEASPDQSTSSSPADYFTAAPTASTGRASSCCSWLCNTKKTQSLICTGHWKERKQKHKKKWKMTVSQMNGYSDAHRLEQSFFWHAPNQKQNDLHAR